MLDVKALRHAMIDADCSTRELASVCHISPSTLYRRLNGKVSFTLGEVMACAERLHLSSEKRNQIFFCGQSFLKETFGKGGTKHGPANRPANGAAGMQADSRVC